MTNPLIDPYFVLTKVYAKGSYLKQAIADTPIEPLQKGRTTKICYGVLEKDVYLNAILEKNCKKQPKSAIRLVLKIALYLMEFMQKHDYMVVDCAVELVKKLGKSGMAGFVNAFLRSYTLPELPQNADERLALATSTPLWLAKKIRRSYKSESEQILSAPALGVSVRFERGEEEYCTAPHHKTPFEHCYIFPNFVRDEGFLLGNYTFQSVGSVAICDLVAPCKRLLDCCAAPGGKSVLLSKKCEQVVASELHAHRAQLIRSYQKRMGAGNVIVEEQDGMCYLPEREQAFDGVLCDVPCSGTGVINENPDIKLFRKEEDIASLNKTQLAILETSANYVKVGGMLYYSTCSILPEENDSIIYQFLQNHSNYELCPIDSPLAHKKSKYGLQFLPHISMGAGFFVTALKRKE